VTATSDPAITSASTASDHASQCLPASPPAPGCASAPVVEIGTSQVVTVTKHLSNLSGYSPVPVSDAVSFVGATESPCTGSYCQNPGVVGPANTVTFADGTTCVVNAAGTNPQTASLTATDTVLTFTFTATCTTNSFFDSLNPEQIALLFEDALSITDSQISDSASANNVVVPIPLAFWNREPFTPTFSATDDNTPPNDTSNLADFPVSDNCTASGAAYPAGIPCEFGVDTSIPSPDPLALALVVVPQPDFTWAPGAATPNGNVVAGFGFALNVDLGLGCVTPVGQTYPASLKDGALPDGSDPTDPTVGTGPEGPDLAGGGATIYNPLVWPTNLNPDATIQAFKAGGALLWARYTSNTAIGTPVNILVYNVGTAYEIYTLTGDPSAAPTPPGQRCTPFVTHTDYLGTDPVTGATLIQCNTAGTKVIVANFIRGDDYESVLRTDTVKCSPAETPTPAATPAGQAPTPTATPVSQTPTPAATPVGQAPTPAATPCCLPRTGGVSSQGDQVPWAVLLAGLAVGSLAAAAFVLSRRRQRPGPQQAG
jgi:hypothetical protein